LFVAIHAYIKKSERSQTNNLMMFLKVLEKQEQVNLKISRHIKIIKIEVEISEMETNRA
jgi:hypothetical protein